MGKARILLVCLALVMPACTEESNPRPEGGRPRPSAADGWVTFTHPVQPWSWRHPPGWRIQTFDDEVGLATHEGAILSNVGHRFRHPDLKDVSTSAWDFSRVPADAVVVELAQVVRLVINCRATTETPVSVAGAEPYGGDHGSPPRRYQSLCVRGQPHFGLNVWFGEDASPEDKAAARKVVRSIRFREPLNEISCDDEAATDLLQEPDYTADYLQRWQTWDQCEVRLDVAMTRTGGCYDGETADLLLGWPLGSSSEDSARVFVRDPDDVFGDEATSEAFRYDIELPPDARDTLLRQYGSPQLWIVPGDDSSVYLVYPDHTERWPLDETPPGCG